MASKNVDTMQVGEWIEALREQITELDERLTPLLDERQRLERQLSILLELKASLDGSSSDMAPNGEGSHSPAVPTTPVTSGSTIKEQVEDGVVEILEDAGQPLHINEIHARYRAKGWRVPGAGEPVNITSHIRESRRIKSPKRGIYGLVEQVGDIAPKKGSKRRSKRS